MCIILSGSYRDWWNAIVRTILLNTERDCIDGCVVITQCLPGVGVPSQYISIHLSLPIPLHFPPLMNKILNCGVCFQKRGVKNYCVDTWLVSLPPTLALTDDTSGCPPPFEMLMDRSVYYSETFILHLFFVSFAKVFPARSTVCLLAFSMTSHWLISKQLFVWQPRHSGVWSYLSVLLFFFF